MPTTRRRTFDVFVRLATSAAVAAFFIASLLLLAHNVSLLSLLDEVGYGDSYVLYDVVHFQTTGVIYRDLSQAPYLPAQYSPMIYVLFALPGRLVAAANPFIGPRVIVLAAFAGCVAIVASITQTLVGKRYAWMWAVLLACSITAVWGWMLQIRSDFIGICFSLMAIRLLLSRAEWSEPAAGLCAGLAMQFKITFAAAAVTGALWLLARYKWRGLALFVGMALVSSVGLYAVFASREPRMVSQMLALSPGILDIGGDAGLLHDAMSEAIVLLALPGIARVARELSPEWALLLLFVAVAMAIATFTDLQAGGNINYYFEPLFALVPFALVGGAYVLSLTSTNPILALFLIAYLAVQYVVPQLPDLVDAVSARRPSVQTRNADLASVQRVLRGRRMFSTVPRLALMDPAPPLMEPYLLSYLHRLGKMDPSLIAKGVYDTGYDVVVTPASRQAWRGIEHIDPEVRKAIASSYAPTCVLGRWLFHSPKRTRSADALAHDLSAIGCVAATEQTNLAW